ncbi:MAG: hypothetical protein GYA33_05495 [Thermogutta sp.]|nr:hypothetical protein [Thermogutta sp.]
MTRRALAGLFVFASSFLTFEVFSARGESPFPGERGERLDLACRDDIWDREPQGFLQRFVRVPRDQTAAFALYTHDHGVLKMSAQLFPLQPNEPREVRLELLKDGEWREVARAAVIYPGWSAHFRLEPWDSGVSVPYRVRHGESAVFEGLIRRDPSDKDEIVVASLSCSSNQDRGDREPMVSNLKRQDPDLLFFAGDQSYDHTEHTAAWLLWGTQFREIIRDRPVVTIPDDHDIGQGNLWGEGGIEADSPAGDSGGYFYPPEYIRMVERCQTWHLPDPADPRPIARGIGVYFTRLRVGGVDFAILEDRKFKSGPKGKIPQMGPRPDHIVDPAYDPRAIDLPGLQLLGERQLAFLDRWSEDWTGAEIKAVLSQTAFCGAAHLHGSRDNRLIADLDCNGWPQSGRNAALRAIRRPSACHLCGDQHLSVVVQHGIETFRDGPFGFTSPAIVNSYYARWWEPADRKPGGNPIPNSPLPYTGDYLDGLGNPITMLAYANPQFDRIQDMKAQQRNPRAKLADGYALIRFNKRARTIRFECWPRYADLSRGDAAQFTGWPITIRVEDNDGRKPTGYLPPLKLGQVPNPVVQVVRESDGEVLYTRRVTENPYRPPVFGEGTYTVKVGRDRPDGWSLQGVAAAGADASPAPIEVELP